MQKLYIIELSQNKPQTIKKFTEYSSNHIRRKRMCKLSEETKENLFKITGIPYEKLIEMDEEEVTSYIEQKNGKKLKFSQPNKQFAGSGDDSVLIDRGSFATMTDVDKQSNKSQNDETKSILNIKDDEDILSNNF